MSNLNWIVLSITSAIFLSCSGVSIKKSSTCSIDDFEALEGCKENVFNFEEIPSTLVHTFEISGFEKDDKIKVEWFYNDGNSFLLVDSFMHYIKLDKELIVSGIDRNFLAPGEYEIRAIGNSNENQATLSHSFTIAGSGEPDALQFIIGDQIDPSGLVIHPRTYFDSIHSRIYLSSYIYNAKPGMKMEILFQGVNNNFEKSFPLTLGPNPKKRFLLYSNLPNENLPQGEYNAFIKFEGTAISAPFFIDGTRKVESDVP